jgi:Helix-turn-helix.
MLEKRDNEFALALGRRVRDLRRKRGLSIGDLAAEIYVEAIEIEALERGESTSVTLVRRVSEAFGTSPDDLIGAVISKNYYSVFLSYGGPDEEVARALYENLRRRKVRCFFFPESAKLGQRLHRTMSDGVADYDRVVLICSQASLDRSGVQNEIEQVLIREAAEGGTELLVPITLDDHVFGAWRPIRCDLARQIRARVVADFRGVEPGTPQWLKQFGRVMRVLHRPTS